MKTESFWLPSLLFCICNDVSVNHIFLDGILLQTICDVNYWWSSVDPSVRSDASYNGLFFMEKDQRRESYFGSVLSWIRYRFYGWSSIKELLKINLKI